MAPLILALGLIGNLTALVVLHKGKLTKIGPVLIYKLLLISVTFYIIQMLQVYFHYAFNLNLITLSRLACKLFNYINYQGDSISPFLIAYISLEKYISIAYLSRRRIMDRTRNQIIYFSLVLLYCSVYTIVIPFCFDLFEYNQTDEVNSTYLSCDFGNYEAQLVANYLDVSSREFMPGILIIFFSAMLVSTIFKSRARVASSLRDQQMRRCTDSN